jgi:hypothetical protein
MAVSTAAGERSVKAVAGVACLGFLPAESRDPTQRGKSALSGLRRRLQICRWKVIAPDAAAPTGESPVELFAAALGLPYDGASVLDHPARELI